MLLVAGCCCSGCPLFSFSFPSRRSYFILFCFVLFSISLLLFFSSSLLLFLTHLYFCSVLFSPLLFCYFPFSLFTLIHSFLLLLCSVCSVHCSSSMPAFFFSFPSRRSYSVLFCSALISSSLAHPFSVRFCTVLFCSVLYRSVLFCSVLYRSVLFCSLLPSSLRYFLSSPSAQSLTLFSFLSPLLFVHSHLFISHFAMFCSVLFIALLLFLTPSIFPLLFSLSPSSAHFPPLSLSFILHSSLFLYLCTQCPAPSHFLPLPLTNVSCPSHTHTQSGPPCPLTSSLAGGPQLGTKRSFIQRENEESKSRRRMNL